MLDDIDKKIIDHLQRKFPLVSRPFRHIAVALVLEEADVIERVKKLKKLGYIRRIGPLFDAATIGYKTCLIAAKVSEDAEKKVVEFINSFDGVTHNYKRKGIYNIWFTLAYKEPSELDELISSLENDYQVDEIIKLPYIKKFKLRTEFNVE